MQFTWDVCDKTNHRNVRLVSIAIGPTFLIPTYTRTYNINTVGNIIVRICKLSKCTSSLYIMYICIAIIWTTLRVTDFLSSQRYMISIQYAVLQITCMKRAKNIKD